MLTPAAKEPVDRAVVVVTFLRLQTPPGDLAPPLPEAAQVRVAADCSVADYRFLYNTVGAGYLWWLRRTMPDRQLELLLRNPRVSISVLYVDDRPAGFYELDGTSWPTVNLSYFGLMPGFVGLGMGYPFLRHAMDTAWRGQPRAMTVNTCTADHPRALPTYLRAGFQPIREIREVWNVPTRLGLAIPAALRV
jgi:GNAT superfamily N-acetyltransferase